MYVCFIYEVSYVVMFVGKGIKVSSDQNSLVLLVTWLGTELKYISTGNEHVKTLWLIFFFLNRENVHPFAHPKG
jgi:hypothetical protein